VEDDMDVAMRSDVTNQQRKRQSPDPADDDGGGGSGSPFKKPHVILDLEGEDPDVVEAIKRSLKEKEEMEAEAVRR